MTFPADPGSQDAPQGAEQPPAPESEQQAAGAGDEKSSAPPDAPDVAPAEPKVRRGQLVTYTSVDPRHLEADGSPQARTHYGVVLDVFHLSPVTEASPRQQVVADDTKDPDQPRLARVAWFTDWAESVRVDDLTPAD